MGKIFSSYLGELKLSRFARSNYLKVCIIVSFNDWLNEKKEYIYTHIDTKLRHLIGLTTVNVEYSRTNYRSLLSVAQGFCDSSLLFLISSNNNKRFNGSIRVGSDSFVSILERCTHQIDDISSQSG